MLICKNSALFQPDCEDRTSSDLTIQFNTPSKGLGQVLHNRQSQAGPSHFARSGFIYTEESLEYPIAGLLRNADTVILDGDRYRVSF